MRKSNVIGALLVSVLLVLVACAPTPIPVVQPAPVQQPTFTSAPKPSLTPSPAITPTPTPTSKSIPTPVTPTPKATTTPAPTFTSALPPTPPTTPTNTTPAPKLTVTTVAPTPTPALTPAPTPTTPTTPVPAPTPTPVPTTTPTTTPALTPTPTQTPATTSTTDVVVTNVVDGDTIEVRISGITDRVRYIGIDTPEKGDWLYEEATKLNEELVYGKTIRLEKDVRERELGDNPRLLRYVYVDGLFVNAELVKAGMARATPYPPDVKNEAFFKQLETEAATSAKGLWAIRIVHIFYDGLVPKVESDEYVEIHNFSGKPVNMTDWKLKDDYGHTFTFPNYVVDAGKTIRVYTNENHPDWGGFSFKSTTGVWNNGGDTAMLYNREGKEVSRKSY